MTEPLETLPSHLAKHADMQLVNLCEGVFVYAPRVPHSLLIALESLGYTLNKGSTDLKDRYPYDIAYNCAIVGKYAFLNAKYTDKVLLGYLAKCNIEPIHVEQGYAKCSTLILSGEAIITADSGIHKKAVSVGIDALLIPPQKNIVLKGYDYGFIGGCGGLISKNKLAFYGNLEALDNSREIGFFLGKHGITTVSLSDENIEDLGGLIPLCSV